MHIHRPVALKSHRYQLTAKLVLEISDWKPRRSGVGGVLTTWTSEVLVRPGQRMHPASLGIQKKRDSSWSPASRNRPAHMDGHTERAKANRYFLALPTTALAPSNPRPRINRMPNGDPVAGSSWGCGAGRGAGRAWCVTGLFCYPSGRSHYCWCPLLEAPAHPLDKVKCLVAALLLDLALEVSFVPRIQDPSLVGSDSLSGSIRVPKPIPSGYWTRSYAETRCVGSDQGLVTFIWG